jgi:hypothetical protein
VKVKKVMTHDVLDPERLIPILKLNQLVQILWIWMKMV